MTDIVVVTSATHVTAAIFRPGAKEPIFQVPRRKPSRCKIPQIGTMNPQAQAYALRHLLSLVIAWTRHLRPVANDVTMTAVAVRRCVEKARHCSVDLRWVQGEQLSVVSMPGLVFDRDTLSPILLKHPTWQFSAVKALNDYGDVPWAV